MLPKRALAVVLTAALAATAWAQDRRPPYWASISSGEALMRTGPGQNFPGMWLYKREGLPVRVVAVHESWRKVEDPDGAQGWMLVRLLSGERTAVIRPGTPRPLRESPSGEAAIRYLAQPGVVGTISDCADGWCKLDVAGRTGHVLTSDLWGVGPREELD